VKVQGNRRERNELERERQERDLQEHLFATLALGMFFLHETQIHEKQKSCIGLILWQRKHTSQAQGVRRVRSTSSSDEAKNYCRPRKYDTVQQQAPYDDQES
jgi:hypothetical protein